MYKFVNVYICFFLRSKKLLIIFYMSYRSRSSLRPGSLNRSRNNANDNPLYMDPNDPRSPWHIPERTSNNTPRQYMDPNDPRSPWHIPERTMNNSSRSKKRRSIKNWISSTFKKNKSSKNKSSKNKSSKNKSSKNKSSRKKGCFSMKRKRIYSE